MSAPPARATSLARRRASSPTGSYDAGVDDQDVDAVLEQAVAQVGVLDAFRVEGPEQDDRRHRYDRSASGSTPRYRRCSSTSAESCGGRRLGGDRAGDHHELALGDRGRHAEVLLDQQNREALLRELLERLDQVLDDRRREALGGLVHHEERRVGEQSAADREHLLLTAGELCAAVSLALGEPREELVDALDVQPLEVSRVAEHPQMLVDRERREQATALRARSRFRSFAILYDGLPTSSLPWKRIEPVTRAGGTPTIALQSVVLPMPFRPTIAVAPPSSENDTSSSACAVP